MTHRILVTDDNSAYRQTAIELLQFEGFVVIEAANGKEAVELAQASHPALILCDVNMPMMDGFAVLAAIKADPQTAAIPFFLVTGRTEASFIQHARDLGADDYMIKPMDIDVLLAKIAQHLKGDSTS